MKKTKIGNSSLVASSVALGIMRMSKLDATQVGEILMTAKNLGINYIDSADVYGNGESEKAFAAGMKFSGLKRDDFFIQSKGGLFQIHKKVQVMLFLAKDMIFQKNT